MAKAAKKTNGTERSATDQAYDGIIELVLHHALRPGEKTSLNTLAERLDIGRTPVKEAVTRLQAEGLLSVSGRSGTMINIIDLKQAEDLFALRKVLEDFAAEEAVKKASDEQIATVKRLVQEMGRYSLGERVSLQSTANFLRSNTQFHAHIVAASHNELLLRVYKQVQMQMQIATYVVWHDYNPKAAARRQAEHEEIANALIRRDGKKLKAALRAHAQAAEKIILAKLKDRQHPPPSEGR